MAQCRVSHTVSHARRSGQCVPGPPSFSPSTTKQTRHRQTRGAHASDAPPAREFQMRPAVPSGLTPSVARLAAARETRASNMTLPPSHCHPRCFRTASRARNAPAGAPVAGTVSVLPPVLPADRQIRCSCAPGPTQARQDCMVQGWRVAAGQPAPWPLRQTSTAQYLCSRPAQRLATRRTPASSTAACGWRVAGPMPPWDRVARGPSAHVHRNEYLYVPLAENWLCSAICALVPGLAPPYARTRSPGGHQNARHRVVCCNSPHLRPTRPLPLRQTPRTRPTRRPVRHACMQSILARCMPSR